MVEGEPLRKDPRREEGGNVGNRRGREDTRRRRTEKTSRRCSIDTGEDPSLPTGNICSDNCQGYYDISYMSNFLFHELGVLFRTDSVLDSPGKFVIHQLNVVSVNVILSFYLSMSI